MQKKLFHHRRLWPILLALVIMLSTAPLSAAADQKIIYDKNTNTAFITNKSAQWTDEENYLAELMLSVNGTENTTPLDVLICLDRSGSMDMNYIQGGSAGASNVGTHFASCPCLQTKHFYLQPVETDVAAPGDGSDLSLIAYDEQTETLTVYNAETDQWVKLDAADEIHLYYEFKPDTASAISMGLAPYHFKKEGGEYIRISQWDTTDVRKKNNEGVWHHANKDEGCFDRWTEAKNAISQFTEEFLAANPANNIALVPFSIRDNTMMDYLNTEPEYKAWLDEQGYSPADPYDTKVPWTDRSNHIDRMLPTLFTTPSTDYIYGLSMAYNMLQERSDEAKATKRAVVIFLSDGTPAGTHRNGSTIFAFDNAIRNVKIIAEAITGTDDVTDPGAHDDLWNWRIPAMYQRHDIDRQYWIIEENSANSNNTKNENVLGVPGLGVEMLTIGYMLDAESSKTCLKEIASRPENFIDIAANSNNTAAQLADRLRSSLLLPGGRDAVLRDVISKYFYIPEDAKLPAGVAVEGTIADGQTLVWTIGDIFQYPKDKEPTITIPLVLREQYRQVEADTYYPTNADMPEPPLDTPDRGPDGPETGGQLHYTDPLDQSRYDTIGTPKLKVVPSAKTPETEKPPTEVPETETPTTSSKRPKPPTSPTIEPEPTPSAPKPEPNVPKDTLIPEDGSGIPLGGYKEDEGTGISDERPPLDEVPKTSGTETPLHLFLLLAGSLLGMSILRRSGDRKHKEDNL